ncbi:MULTISPECIES: endo alpha-1,4 polygalactosaminidase [unclassified Nocardioides]|uniref:endo alpha-1,4 polygalactosaminidase n=1 Tax=unclassified Nocardioides TaxID=2615069 RepID=UPI0007025868|nr:MULTISPECIES: endo alpha-1,4 polygalactosaminidase [unclassified Nocardioides]KRC48794.1 hypothetical protein ASE19_17895 [Nocardioides sp. Root79]KRC75193.1 hypothetical protein ASE20_19795 [Nocardioides sp. Root240]
MISALVLSVVLALAPTVTPPPGGGDVDYQLGGAVRPDPRVEIVVRDRNAAPARGRYNVCYVNGFQTQPDEARFWRQRWSLVLKRGGRPVLDEAWGEWLLDIRTPTKRAALARIVGRWIDGCARNGYDAVELDNLDSWSRSHGLVTRAQAKAFARLLVRRAHADGLAVGQKNWPELDGTTLGFDFAVAEECGRYAECGRYRASYGNRVLVIEYRRTDFQRACARWGAQLGIVLRDRALSPRGVRSWC